MREEAVALAGTAAASKAQQAMVVMAPIVAAKEAVTAAVREATAVVVKGVAAAWAGSSELLSALPPN